MQEREGYAAPVAFTTPFNSRPAFISSARRSHAYPEMGRDRAPALAGGPDLVNRITVEHAPRPSQVATGLCAVPDEVWMQQISRNATDDGWETLDRRRYALQDRDTKQPSSSTDLLARGLSRISPQRAPTAPLV